MAEILFIDILGLNVPRIAVTRTWKERLDTAVSELTNTSATVFGMLAIAPLAHKLAQKVSGVPLEAINREVGAVTAKMTPRVQLARLAATTAFLFPFASMPWGNPFLRNWVTLKKNKISHFDSLIGLNKTQEKAKVSLDKEMNKQLRSYAAVQAVGVGLALASAIGFGLWARKTNAKQLGPIMNWMSKTFDLKGKNANQIEGLSAFLFWSAPAYLGWLHASRGKSETWEWILKFANTTMWFFVFGPKIMDPLCAGFFNRAAKGVNPAFKNLFKTAPSYKFINANFTGKMRDTLLRVKTTQYASRMIFSTFMMGVTPQLLNIYLTKQRFNKKMEAHKKLLEQRTANQAPQNLQATGGAKPELSPLAVSIAAVPTAQSTAPLAASYQTPASNPWMAAPYYSTIGNTPLYLAGSPRAQTWMTYPKTNQAP